MSWRKKSRSVFKKATSPMKKKMGMIGGLLKKASGSDDEGGGGEEGMRSEAAKRLVNRNQQAGSGSINFNTEEYVE